MSANTIIRTIMPDSSIVSIITADNIIFHVNSWFEDNTSLEDILMAVANEKILKTRVNNDINKDMMYNFCEGNSHIDA